MAEKKLNAAAGTFQSKGNLNKIGLVATNSNINSEKPDNGPKISKIQNHKQKNKKMNLNNRKKKIIKEKEQEKQAITEDLLKKEKEINNNTQGKEIVKEKEINNNKSQQKEIVKEEVEDKDVKEVEIQQQEEPSHIAPEDSLAALQLKVKQLQDAIEWDVSISGIGDRGGNSSRNNQYKQNKNVKAILSNLIKEDTDRFKYSLLEVLDMGNDVWDRPSENFNNIPFQIYSTVTEQQWEQNYQSNNNKNSRQGRGRDNRDRRRPYEPLPNRADNAWKKGQLNIQDESVVYAKKALGILNKISPSTFWVLMQQLAELIVNEEVLDAVIEQIFDKALEENKFTGLYAELCLQLARYELKHGFPFDIKQSPETQIPQSHSVFSTPQSQSKQLDNSPNNQRISDTSQSPAAQSPLTNYAESLDSIKSSMNQLGDEKVSVTSQDEVESMNSSGIKGQNQLKTTIQLIPRPTPSNPEVSGIQGEDVTEVEEVKQQEAKKGLSKREKKNKKKEKQEKTIDTKVEKVNQVENDANSLKENELDKVKEVDKEQITDKNSDRDQTITPSSSPISSIASSISDTPVQPYLQLPSPSPSSNSSNVDMNQFSNSIFRKRLLKRCQNFFENNQVLIISDQDRAQMSEVEYSDKETIFRLRKKGNIFFIGELINIRLLHPQVGAICISELWKGSTQIKVDAIELEALQYFLTAVGSLMMREAKNLLTTNIQKIQQIIKYGLLKDHPRVKFLLMNVIDFYNNNNFPIYKREYAEQQPSFIPSPSEQIQIAKKGSDQSLTILSSVAQKTRNQQWKEKSEQRKKEKLLLLQKNPSESITPTSLIDISPSDSTTPFPIVIPTPLITHSNTLSTNVWNTPLIFGHQAQSKTNDDVLINSLLQQVETLTKDTISTNKAISDLTSSIEQELNRVADSAGHQHMKLQTPCDAAFKQSNIPLVCVLRHTIITIFKSIIESESSLKSGKIINTKKILGQAADTLIVRSYLEPILESLISLSIEQSALILEPDNRIDSNSSIKSALQKTMDSLQSLNKIQLIKFQFILLLPLISHHLSEKLPSDEQSAIHLIDAIPEQILADHQISQHFKNFCSILLGNWLAERMLTPLDVIFISIGLRLNSQHIIEIFAMRLDSLSDDESICQDLYKCTIFELKNIILQKKSNQQEKIKEENDNKEIIIESQGQQQDNIIVQFTKHLINATGGLDTLIKAITVHPNGQKLLNIFSEGIIGFIALLILKEFHADSSFSFNINKERTHEIIDLIKIALSIKQYDIHVVSLVLSGVIRVLLAYSAINEFNTDNQLRIVSEDEKGQSNICISLISLLNENLLNIKPLIISIVEEGQGQDKEGDNLASTNKLLAKMTLGQLGRECILLQNEFLSQSNNWNNSEYSSPLDVILSFFNYQCKLFTSADYITFGRTKAYSSLLNIFMEKIQPKKDNEKQNSKDEEFDENVD
ncbi:MAG: hypothetical protein EZS28_006266 [Streblomastix strix]|uniref:MIF4G domain-containing protein n=1 Tax=Streblomastix strix TaxID=222440 RepID=A0A5J4WSU0_9EUKA|nr:MAG: hypothetical protein EZS28_006266 [Streblomastix strix]